MCVMYSTGYPSIFFRHPRLECYHFKNTVPKIHTWSRLKRRKLLCFSPWNLKKKMCVYFHMGTAGHANVFFMGTNWSYLYGLMTTGQGVSGGGGQWFCVLSAKKSFCGMSDYLPRTVIILLLAFDHLSMKKVIGYGGSLLIHCWMTTPPSSTRKGSSIVKEKFSFQAKFRSACLCVP